VALIRRKAEPVAEPEPAPPTPVGPGVKKARPTPTRKEAEAARRQRVRQQTTNRQARQAAARKARADRMRTLAERDQAPEKALMRDYIDARLNLGEFLLPSVVVILAITLLGSYFPNVAIFTTLLMYLFILAVFVDGYLMWRGFKKVLAQRYPNAPTRGLLMYGMTRSTQIRRFRLPSPRLKRGDTY
jgi:cation transport ATPase